MQSEYLKFSFINNIFILPFCEGKGNVIIVENVVHILILYFMYDFGQYSIVSCAHHCLVFPTCLHHHHTTIVSSPVSKDSIHQPTQICHSLPIIIFFCFYTRDLVYFLRFIYLEAVYFVVKCPDVNLKKRFIGKNFLLHLCGKYNCLQN